MGEPNIIEVRFRHAPDELGRHTLRNLFRQHGWIWVAIVALWVLAAALVALLGFLGSPDTWRMGALLGVVGGLAVVVLALTVVMVRVNARRTLSSSKELAGELRYEFGRDSFRYESDYSSATVIWDALHSAVERDDAFLLFPSKQHFTLLPKRGFTDGTDLEHFRTLLKQTLGSRFT